MRRKNQSLVPQRSVEELITGRIASRGNPVTITETDLCAAQTYWNAVTLYRLDPDRRQAVCKLLVSLVKKPATKREDATQAQFVAPYFLDLWEKVAKDPSYVDALFDPTDEVGY